MSSFSLQIDVSVIIVHDGRVLLMQRPAHDHNFPLHWGIPGGGFEPEDTNLEAAGAREVREEVGVSIQNLRLVANNYQVEGNILFVVFSAEYAGEEITIDLIEVAQAGWFSLNEIDNKQFTSTTEGLVRKLLA